MLVLSGADCIPPSVLSALEKLPLLLRILLKVAVFSLMLLAEVSDRFPFRRLLDLTTMLLTVS